MSLTSKLVEQVSKPAMTGLLAYVGSMAVCPDQRANLFGFESNNHVFYGALGVGGSFIGELAHNWILPHIPSNSKFLNTESMILSPAVVGGVFALGTKYMVSPNGTFDQPVPLYKPFLLGAGSEIAGSYAYEAVLKPYLK